MTEKKTYSIGEISSSCSVSVRTLRYYERIGVLLPAVKKDSGYRYYGKEQILQLHLINRLKDMGFSLDAIKDILEKDNLEFLEKRVAEKLDEFQRKMEDLQVQALGIRIFLDRIRYGKDILTAKALDALDVIFAESPLLEQIPAQDLISIRRTQSNYCNEEVNIDRWSELFDLAKKEDVLPVGPLTVVYHCNPLEQFYQSECDYEVCMAVPSAKNKAHFYREDAFLAVTAIHVGKYSTLISTYLNIMKWISENGYRLVGPFRDEFIVSPVDTRNEDEFITKIVVPVEKIDAKRQS